MLKKNFKDLAVFQCPAASSTGLDNDDGHRYAQGVIRRNARCVLTLVEVAGERRIALASLPSALSPVHCLHRSPSNPILTSPPDHRYAMRVRVQLRSEAGRMVTL